MAKLTEREEKSNTLDKDFGAKQLKVEASDKRNGIRVSKSVRCKKRVSNAYEISRAFEVIDQQQTVL